MIHVIDADYAKEKTNYTIRIRYLQTMQHIEDLNSRNPLHPNPELKEALVRAFERIKQATHVGLFTADITRDDLGNDDVAAMIDIVAKFLRDLGYYVVPLKGVTSTESLVVKWQIL